MAQSRIERKRQKKKRPFRRFLKIMFFTFLGLFLLTGGTLAYLGFKINDLTTSAHQELERGEHSDYRDSAVKPTDDPVSILFLGIDSRDGNLSGRTDAMILATFNPDEGTIKMLNIPRDSYVEIVGRYNMDKINHAHSFGGIDMTIDTVENLLNIPVDYFATLNFDAFMEIIDELGGIEVNSPMTFTETDDDTYGTITIHKGEQTLNGAEALAYVRMRKSDPLGDLGRGERQKEVLSSIIKKAASFKTITRFGSLMESLENNLNTNVKFSDILSMHTYANDLGNIESLTFEGENYMHNGVYYYKLYDDSVAEISTKLQVHLGLKDASELPQKEEE